MSAVSKSVTPSSSARLTIALVCSASHLIAKLLQPRPTAETLSPDFPMLRYSTAPLFLLLLFIEDREGQQRRDHEIRHVNHFAKPQVNRHAANRVSLLPAPATLHQQRDHVHQRVMRRHGRVLRFVDAVADAHPG